MTVPVDGARHVAIRSTGAGSLRARDGVTVVTGTVTGSGRPQRRSLPNEKVPTNESVTYASLGVEPQPILSSYVAPPNVFGDPTNPYTAPADTTQTLIDRILRSGQAYWE